MTKEQIAHARAINLILDNGCPSCDSREWTEELSPWRRSCVRCRFFVKQGHLSADTAAVIDKRKRAATGP